ncbi:restriction endonuclease subunit S [Candidatus Chryseobacterium massiliae]|uniref:Restriction endonuclease subunit S n=2 Tax=Chryseobacterium group TaxID=2782232 RepID=A0A3D9AI60_9FLAO|nr:restriction endonuclease subunit S [Candidatus Chryseobacterium massiliae]
MMQRYEKYRDSGVDWIGEIPKNWEIVRFKRLFKEKKKTTDASLNSGSISFGEVVYKNDEKITEATKLSYQVLNKGEFLLNPLNMNYDLKSLRIGLSSINVVVSSGYIILQSKKGLNKNYYRWLLRVYDIVFMKTLGAGVRQTINYNDLADSHLVVPSLEEQQTIATFLDDKTAKIDQTIAIKEKEIELLKERRQILIQKAVTKGLDDTVTLKDSGVDWIGDIPEHWEVRKLVSLCRFVRGNSPFGKDELLNAGEYIALQYGKTYKVNEVNEGYSFYVNNEFYKNSQVVNYGDVILVSTSETIEDLGHTVYYRRNEIGLLGGEQIMLKPNQEQVDSHFLYFSAKVFSKELQKFATGIKVFRFNINDLKTIFNAVPPISEQKEIANFIEINSNKIAKAILLKQQEIEKLKEYKTVLIDNVVTGKVRVS